MSPQIIVKGKRNPLPTEESELRKQLEKTVANIAASVVAAGNALTEIRDKKLFRSTHDTFEQYCIETWGFHRANAYRLIDIAAIAKKMSPVGYILSGRVARALKGVTSDKQQEVFSTALAAAKSAGRSVTGKDIERAARPSLANEITEPTKGESAKENTAETEEVTTTATPQVTSTRKKKKVKSEIMEPAIESNSAGGVKTPPSITESDKPISTVDMPSPASVTTQLKKLWKMAKPTERENFLSWLEEQKTAKDEPKFECDNCGETFTDDDDAATIYECACGTFFSDGFNGSRNCPDCGKLGALFTRCGCSVCDEGALQKIDDE